MAPDPGHRRSIRVNLADLARRRADAGASTADTIGARRCGIIPPLDLGTRYDEQYYRNYHSALGLPYDRHESWLSFFGSIADRIVATINPRTVLDAGCAKGFLVEALRDRNVEAYGLDISSYAIGQVREDVRPYCWVASVADPFPRRYDLILCIEVLEHLPPDEAERAIANLCRHADDILFSSSPDDDEEETHVNLRPVEYWAERFAAEGFGREVDFDAGFIARHAFRFRRAARSLPSMVADYERRLWAQAQELDAVGRMGLRLTEINGRLTREQYLSHRARRFVEQERARLEGARRHLEHALNQRVAELEQAHDAVREAHRSLQEAHRSIQDAHRRLAEQDGVVTGLAARVKDMEASLGWRLLAPYRGLKERLAPPGTGRRAVYDVGLATVKVALSQGPMAALRAARAGPPSSAPVSTVEPLPAVEAAVVDSPAPSVVGAPTSDVAAATWGTRILMISGSHGDMERYRCHHAREQLGRLDVPCDLLQLGDPALPGVLGQPDLVVLHRVPHSEYVDGIVRAVRSRGAIVLFDIDDLVFEPSLASRIDALQPMDPVQRGLYLDGMRRYRYTLALCDGALVSTDYLVEAVAKLGKPAWVHRNALSDELLALSQAAYEGRRPAGDRVVVGYASGTRTHNRDFAEIESALQRLLDEFPRVELRIVGYLDLGKGWEKWAHRVRRVPFVPWRELPAILAQFDVNLAPLEAGNPFCLAKSELKYVEAAAVGVPTVASDAGAFQHAIRHGETGFLAGGGDEWLEALRRLVADPSLRSRLGEQARADALRRYHPATRAAELRAVLDQAAETARRLPPPPDPAAIIATLAEAEPDLLGPAELRGPIVFKEHALARDILDGLRGLEIGAAAHNPFGLDTRNVMLRDGYDFYVEHELKEMGVEPVPVDIWAPADAIPVPDRSEDFILTSHVVEHLPDLIRAFEEWNRIVRDCGYVFMIVPLKGALEADRPRELTPFAHFLDDYLRGATLDTHPTDGVPGGRMGHYHTFTPESILEIVEWLRKNGKCHWELVAREDVDTKVGNGFTLCFLVLHPD
jgi:glycosyltransferase involved in cell wall biosynthesis/2-polyprenyl-3-methyl-5-hydroxy-6-metoxy-1,4-benzoquinol methylase